MTIDITIIENDLEEMNHLQNTLNAWSYEKSFPVSITTYMSGEEYFASNSSHASDLFFLDIQLSGMNGMDIAKRLRNNDYTGEIIFLTSFREYVFDGYQVHALNYLLKPPAIPLLYSCLNEVAESLKTNFYVFRYKQEIIQIEYRDILCLSSFLHSIDIITREEHFAQYASLNAVLSCLPKQFVRVHRSHIVNMAHIHKISGNTITLSNRTTVPIGRQYVNDVRNAFTEYSTRFDNYFDQENL